MNYKCTNEVVNVIKYCYQQGYDVQHANKIVWLCKGRYIDPTTIQMFYDMFKEQDEES